MGIAGVWPLIPLRKGRTQRGQILPDFRERQAWCQQILMPCHDGFQTGQRQIVYLQIDRQTFRCGQVLPAHYGIQPSMVLSGLSLKSCA
ncbi:MAG: hypothetical protein CMF04_02910 [Hyphomonas sp.]|nr:hypothetical protein [Hyphomonas sp.]